jgi:hypothetical protein
MKRGRPPLPPERRRNVRITVNVCPDVADGVFLYARRHREASLSEALAKLLERLARREQELGVALISEQH